MIFPVSIFTISEKESVISESIKMSIESFPGVLILTTGRRVSILSDKVLLSSDPSAFSFPAESENFVSSTLITPSVVLSAVGVNVAV